ncbi:MAG: NADH-quinone oxidoreductase subunit L [Bacteroidota bacterium]
MNELIILLPLVGALVNGLLGFTNQGYRKNETLIGALGTAMVAIPFLLVLWAFVGFEGEAITFSLFTWMEAGDLQVNFAYQLDQLSLVMGLVVTGVGSLIHIYSMSYMHGDPGYYKFFTYLNLFIFSMNNLILGDNMVVMFLGWEGVGLCSYLLIGFWYQNMEYSKAAQKAFVANRIGDFAMLVAMFLIFQELTLGGGVTGLTFNEILAADFGDRAYWIALLVFIAATGKSAQIPLYVWLPDAMAGPTPVSALIHAATMVTSGIYLIARLSPIYLQVPEVMTIVLVIGGLTAILAALIAMAQNDIKKVLAYSTVSQLGYMFMALGAGAYTAAIFHVVTHAFFKACLFLGSGSVIHAMEHTHAVEDPQDIRTMGGLKKYMPATRTTFWISSLAISGIIPLSGFFSKDEILASVFFYADSFSIYHLFYGIGLFTALLTAFYMTRVSMLTFEGEERFAGEHKPHESPALMTIPLWILASLAVIGGFMNLPVVIAHGEFQFLGHFLEAGGVENAASIHDNATVLSEIILIAVSCFLAIGAVLFARNFYGKNQLAGDAKLQSSLGGLYGVMANKFYVDEWYQRLIIGPFMQLGKQGLAWLDRNVIDAAVDGTGQAVSSIGQVFKRLQSGLVSNYLLLVSAGVVAMMAYLLLG